MTHKPINTCIILGNPLRPTNLDYFEVTQNSVRLTWNSGFDMGSQQHFVVVRLYDGERYKVQGYFSFWLKLKLKKVIFFYCRSKTDSGKNKVHSS